MDFSDFAPLEEKLKTNLSQTRFKHTLGVAYTAASLAMRYDYDINKAYLAGLFHDCAKQYKTDEQIKLAEKLNIELSESEIKSPQIIHAKTGAVLAKSVYGVEDSEILDAIRTHTTGMPGMSLLQKIVYVADYIEPRRDRQPRLSQIRKAAFDDIDDALFMILEDSVTYLEEHNPDNINEETVRTFEFYRKEK